MCIACPWLVTVDLFSDAQVLLFMPHCFPVVMSPYQMLFIVAEHDKTQFGLWHVEALLKVLAWMFTLHIWFQVKTALEQQNGAAPSDEETFNELFSKEIVDRQTIRDVLAAVKQAAEEKAAAEAAAAAAAAEQEAAAADVPAPE